MTDRQTDHRLSLITAMKTTYPLDGQRKNYRVLSLLKNTPLKLYFLYLQWTFTESSKEHKQFFLLYKRLILIRCLKKTFYSPRNCIVL